MKKLKTTINERIEFDLNLVQNFEYIVGIDEVGWGCIAGNLYLGAVAISKEELKTFNQLVNTFPILSKIRDSKKLPESTRKEIYLFSTNNTLKNIEYCLGEGNLDTINNKGLVYAFEEALLSIFNQLKNKNIPLEKCLFLMDGSRVPKPLLNYNTKLVIKGDDLSLCIGWASILAKEFRDEYMNKLAKEFPQYFWEDNKGYGTSLHTEALKKFGLCKYHRVKASEKIIS